MIMRRWVGRIRTADEADYVAYVKRTGGADYAETLRRWRERYEAARSAGRLKGFADEFHDLWRYYLMYCEGGFRGGAIDVAQVTLAGFA